MILNRLDPSASRFISYVALNRLIQVDEGVPAVDGGMPLPVEDYGYDEEGNRTASHLSALYISNAHNQLEEDDSYTYAYDARGNRTSRTSKATGAVETYSYDSQNRLIGYTDGATVANYNYDALGRRIAKTVNLERTEFVYESSDLSSSISDDIVLEFGVDGLSRRWLHSVNVDEPLGLEVYANDDTPGAGMVYEIYSDRMGSIVAVVDVVSSTRVAAYSYDSYGHRRSVATSMIQRFGFAGREHDEESGLIYLRARYFDPRAGVFLSPDPIRFDSGDMNLYRYVANDPLNFVDPSGLLLDERQMKRRMTLMETERTLIAVGEAGMRAAAVTSISAGLGMGVLDILAKLESTLDWLPDEEIPLPEASAAGGDNGNCTPPTDGHHSIPREILKMIRHAGNTAALTPSVTGVKGSPNIIPVPKDQHVFMHSKPGKSGLRYNDWWKQQIQARGGFGKVTEADLLDLRGQARDEFCF